MGGAAPIWAAFWAGAMGAFGVLLALINIWFTCPCEVQ